MAVIIVGTLDTKGEEIDYVREVLETGDVDVHVIDAGVVGEPTIEPDTPSTAVAAAGGSSLATLREQGDRGAAVDVMGDGAAAIARSIYDDGELDGILGVGGSGNTSIATAAMRALPYGVPKLMVSTMASGDVRPYVGPYDIVMMHAVADIEGLNQLTRTVLSNAAHAMSGMVGADVGMEASTQQTIAITMFGVTTPCVKTARSYLEANGYETIVFHATGTGGQAMENLIEEGVIDGVLDVTTTELADEHVGGVLSAGPDRLTVAGAHGIPQVVSVGALDMVNFGPADTVPAAFQGRRFHQHNPQVTLMRTTREENEALGRTIASKLNAAKGPVTIALPLQGVSMLDRTGEDFHDPDADEALFNAIANGIDDEVELLEIDAHINDEQFSQAIADRLIAYLTA